MKPSNWIGTMLKIKTGEETANTVQETTKERLQTTIKPSN